MNHRIITVESKQNGKLGLSQLKVWLKTKKVTKLIIVLDLVIANSSVVARQPNYLRLTCYFTGARLEILFLDST